ncbi:phenylalanine--tRNA ligase subunit alpha [Candidatus Parcubacteria bacterium]|nr:phenylalanine--tRNA ligase subunit alpha [Candidatus Parcubacteria bacterium]
MVKTPYGTLLYITVEKQGHFHPLTLVTRHIAGIFKEMGFAVASGPEAETERYNFDVLNIPPDHPARDMWDTFWLKDARYGELLRTHTSPVQARYMEANEPPIRIIAPGKVFRYEATDATHEAQFHQIEGLMIGEDVSLAHLKGVLEVFFEKFFGKETGVRLRPGYFPFVEPGVEVDISCFKCGGKGCSLCKQSGFIEIMGAGMVHPYVLNQVGVDPRKYQGFAFGTGVDRLALLKYGIDDVRLFYQGDLRLVNQF